MILSTLLIVWAFGWGWWSQDGGVIPAAFWPALWPLGMAYHWWRWGSKRGRRFVYLDTRWWQRGDKVRRPR